VSIAVVLAVMFLLGTAETFADTTTSALTPMVVGKRDLGIANARVMGGFIVANQLAGPPVGAALFAAGTAWPFVAQAVLVALGVVLVSRVVLPRHGVDREATPTRVLDDIREGWQWLWHHPPVRTLALTIVTFNVTFGCAWAVLVLYSRDRLGLGAVGFGLITTVSALGGLVGTAAYGWLERNLGLAMIMRVGLVIETLTHLVLALTTWAWLALVVFFVFGVHAFVWGFLVSSVLVWHGSFCINSLAHLIGKRRYATTDDSRNSFILAVITTGEGWHNNHHHYPSAARQGFRWWEIDVTYYVLCALEKVGLVWDLRQPTAAALAGPMVATVDEPPASGRLAAG